MKSRRCDAGYSTTHHDNAAATSPTATSTHAAGSDHNDVDTMQGHARRPMRTGNQATSPTAEQGPDVALLHGRRA
jgi:hypothetical protein